MTYTPEPASRETDVKIARAMGWRAIGTGVHGLDWIGIAPITWDNEYAPIPGYTTGDWSAVGAMIAWLEAHHLRWSFERQADGMIACEALPTDDQHTAAIARGETVGLVVGRVVLGVAEVVPCRS